MIAAVLMTAVLCLLMVLPYLPGRFDAAAATLSFVVQVASYVSLLMVPVGLAWLMSPGRSALWRRVATLLAWLVALAITVAATSMNQLAVGAMVGAAAIIVLRRVLKRQPSGSEPVGRTRHAAAIVLVGVPLILMTLRATVIPRAAAWSRDRAIEHSAPLIAEIESFRERRGHYPISLQALHSDIPTGVVGIDRFHYEPIGQAYNLFFIRPHIALDAVEVIMFNPRDEHRFASHALDILQYDGAQLDRRRGDGRRSPLAQPHWISVLFD